MSNLGCANEEAVEDRSDREHSSTPSAETQTGHPRGAWSAVRKRHSCSEMASHAIFQYNVLAIDDTQHLD